MASAYIIPVTLLAIGSLGSAQILGDPGKEPWYFSARNDCGWRSTTYLEPFIREADACIQQVIGNNPLAICSKREERNECLKPYYNATRQCYNDRNHDKEQQEMIDEAFEAQDKAVDYMCEDNGKRLKELDGHNCRPKQEDKCVEDMKRTHIEGNGLFREPNKCKYIHWMVKCTREQYAYCNDSMLTDFMVGQINAMSAATPCGEANGVSSNLNAFAVPILLFSLLCHGAMKIIF